MRKPDLCDRVKVSPLRKRRMKKDKITCPSCGGSIWKDSVFCTHCGYQIPVDDKKDIPKNIMVRVEKVNGSMKRPGDWDSRTWVVYYDRKYSMTEVDVPEYKRERKIFQWQKSKKNDNRDHEVWDVMDQKSFDELKAALNAVPWTSLEARNMNYDGIGWKIEYYSEEGVLAGSTGAGRLVEIMDNTDLLQVVGRIPEIAYFGPVL